MLSRKGLIGFAILACSSTAVSAQDIAGNWSATLDTPQGPFAMAFEFMVDEGTKLVGSMINDFIGAIPISDGSIEGNDVSFKALIEGAPGGTLTMNFEGQVEGDELTLTIAVEGMPPGADGGEQTFVATRDD